MLYYNTLVGELVPFAVNFDLPIQLQSMDGNQTNGSIKFNFTILVKIKVKNKK